MREITYNDGRVESKSFKSLEDAMKAEIKEVEKVQLVKVWPVGRNDKCFCGSGKKYKKCCMEHKS